MGTMLVKTSDGMLTKASQYVPAGSRAKTITVSSKATASKQEIEVSISPSTILNFTTTLPISAETISTLQSFRKTNNRGTYWHGSAWTLVDTTSWYHVPFAIEESDAVYALIVEDAIVEHLRHIMNRELKIRPVITDYVCEQVAKSIKSKLNEQKTFKGVRNSESE
jgi:hypothetical protein